MCSGVVCKISSFSRPNEENEIWTYLEWINSAQAWSPATALEVIKC